MADLENAGAQPQSESESEESSSSTFSFPLASASSAASEVRAGSPSLFTFDSGAESPEDPESVEYETAVSCCSEIAEISTPEESQSQAESVNVDPEFEFSPDQISTPTDQPPAAPGTSGASSKPPGPESRLCRGILGQLIGNEEDDRHCDVLDVVRRGVHNWRMMARMSGWLACRGCCYKPVNCCHLSTTTIGSPKAGDLLSHTKDPTQDSSCCARKSTLTPLRSSSHATPPATPKSIPKKESPQASPPPSSSSGACGSSARRSSVSPLRSSRLSSADELSVHVPPGMIGLAWLDNEPLLLTSKSYTFPLASSFSLQELALESTRVIHHGCLHRITIPDGKLGVAWVDGQAKVLEPGTHVLTCSTFAYSSADDRDASHREVALGPFRVITVTEDEVGVKYCNRKPHLLYAGRHLIDISRVEVFAGFESLRIRKTYASDLVACSRDEMMVEAHVSFRWQIAPQDIATARGASVADIEGAVVGKLRRAFAIVFWCLKGEELSEPYSLMKEDAPAMPGPLKAFSNEISKKCLEAVVDLFDEGWSVTFWGMWFDSLKLRRYSRVRPVKSLMQNVQQESKMQMPKKKKVQIVVTEEES